MAHITIHVDVWNSVQQANAQLQATCQEQAAQLERAHLEQQKTLKEFKALQNEMEATCKDLDTVTGDLHRLENVLEELHKNVEVDTVEDLVFVQRKYASGCVCDTCSRTFKNMRGLATHLARSSCGRRT